MRHQKSVHRDFVFIGGGSVGPVLIIYLAQLAEAQKLDLSGVVFHLVDPKGYGNGGIAYGKNAPGHILNTLRSEMSPWERNKFHDYLLSLGRADDPLQFNLRSDYGAFLQRELQDAKAQLRAHGVQIVEHNQVAYVRRVADTTFKIVGKGGFIMAPSLGALPASNIVLTVGYGPNDNFQALRAYSACGFVDTIYPIRELQATLLSMHTPVRVAALGSAAALYDFAVACPLSAQDMQLFVFSSASAGLEVREVENEHLLKDLRLHHLKCLPATASASEIEQAIDAEFREAQQMEAGPDTWIAFRIMGVIGPVLEKVDPQVAIEFRKSTMFKRIKRLGGSTTRYSRAKLEEYAPAFIPVSLAPKDITFTPAGACRITASGHTYEVDVVVNVSGHGRHNTSILEDMKTQGLAEVHPGTDVLSTDESGLYLKRSGIACIGPATHFGTDGIETFARPASVLARLLVQRMG